jgi:hypothetical protein
MVWILVCDDDEKDEHQHQHPLQHEDDLLEVRKTVGIYFYRLLVDNHLLKKDHPCPNETVVAVAEDDDDDEAGRRRRRHHHHHLDDDVASYLHLVETTTTTKDSMFVRDGDTVPVLYLYFFDLLLLLLLLFWSTAIVLVAVTVLVVVVLVNVPVQYCRPCHLLRRMIMMLTVVLHLEATPCIDVCGVFLLPPIADPQFQTTIQERERERGRHDTNTRSFTMVHKECMGGRQCVK